MGGKILRFSCSMAVTEPLDTILLSSCHIAFTKLTRILTKEIRY